MATPLLHSEGDFKGKLKGVSFLAASVTNTIEWFATNCGQFEFAFSKIMPVTVAHTVARSLMHGKDVELPGLYEEEQFDHGFLFEWSPALKPAQTNLPAQGRA